MNKLMVIFAALCIAVPAVAMELVMMTEKDNSAFVARLSKRIILSNEMKKEKEISGSNPINLALNKLSTDLSQYGDNIQKMLSRDQEMKKNISCLLTIDNEPSIQLGLEQIRNGSRNTEIAREYVIKARQILADLAFKKQCKEFQCRTINGTEMSDEDIKDFLSQNNNNLWVRNNTTDYDHTIKKYSSLLVYQMLFAYL